MKPEFTKLQTERLIIRPFHRSDLTSRYISWLNDPETSRYSELRHTLQTKETCTAYFDRMKRAGNWFLAIIRKDGKPAHIGNLSVEFERSNQIADMAIVLGEKTAWGCGYGREAWKAVLDHLLQSGHAYKVRAGTMAENKTMIGVALASGMSQEAVQRGEYLLNGKRVDRLRFASFARGQH